MQGYNGKQAGNPEKFAQMIFDTSRMQKVPLHLFVGDNAYKNAQEKIKNVQNDMQKSESYAGKVMDFNDFGKSAFDKS